MLSRSAVSLKSNQRLAGRCRDPACHLPTPSFTAPCLPSKCSSRVCVLHIMIGALWASVTSRQEEAGCVLLKRWWHERRASGRRSWGLKPWEAATPLHAARGRWHSPEHTAGCVMYDLKDNASAYPQYALIQSAQWAASCFRSGLRGAWGWAKGSLAKSGIIGIQCYSHKRLTQE